MKKREFVIVLVCVAVVVVWLGRERGDLERVRPVATSTPVPAATSLPPSAAALEELKLEKGPSGHEEVRSLPVPQPNPALLARGREVYQANCVLCHGETLRGDGPGGANLDPPPSNLRAPEQYKYGHLESAVFRTTMYGIEGTGMAPWEGILSPEDIWAVTHYVRSIQGTPD